MEEKDENVVKETTQETTEQVEETIKVDESKFESAGDDSVLKVDLSKPPKPIEENEEPTNNKQTEEVQEKVIEETTSKEEVTEKTSEENTETQESSSLGHILQIINIMKMEAMSQQILTGDRINTLA